MGLTRRHVLLVVPLAALLCGPLYAKYLPPMAVPFALWWEVGCVAFAAFLAWRVYGAEPPARRARKPRSRSLRA
jgi:hypothetical protein